MDQGLALGIVGTVATLVFGALGVYLAIRRVYPGRLLFVKEDCIGLFDSIVRNLPELSVQFKGAPVKENLVLLKGFFLNTGHKDISLAMVEQRLQAILPEGYRWLTAKVVAASPAVKATVQVASETSLEFDLGLFRCGEFLRFEALAEVPTLGKNGPAPADSLEGDLTFDHRIADTGRIKAADIPPEATGPSQAYVKIIAVAFFIFASLVIVLGPGAPRPNEESRTVSEILRGVPPKEHEAKVSDLRGASATNGRAFMIIRLFAGSAALWMTWYLSVDLWRLNKFRKIRAISSGGDGPSRLGHKKTLGDA